MTQDELEIRRLIDEIHLKYPFMGSRRIRNELAKRDKHVNRKRIIRMMTEMRIRAIYPKVKTTIPNKEHKVYPYLLRNLSVTYPNQVWATESLIFRWRKDFVSCCDN